MTDLSAFPDGPPRRHPDDPRPTPALASAGHAQDGPTPGGTLVIGIATSPGHLNPAISTGSEVHTVALERGELDFVSGVPASERERIEATPSLTTYTPNSGPGGGFCVMTMTFNLERELLANRAVRVALAHAIDRQQLLDQVLYGSGRVATGPIHSGLAAFYTDDVTPYPFDPERAAHLLGEAGYPAGADGVRFTIDFLHFPLFAKYGEVLRQNLAAVGVRVELVALDRAAFVTRVFTQRDRARASR